MVSDALDVFTIANAVLTLSVTFLSRGMTNFFMFEDTAGTPTLEIRVPAEVRNSNTVKIETTRSVVIRAQLVAPLEGVPDVRMIELFDGIVSELTDPVNVGAVESVVVNGTVEATPTVSNSSTMSVADALLSWLITWMIVVKLFAPPSNDPAAT